MVATEINIVHCAGTALCNLPVLMALLQAPDHVGGLSSSILTIQHNLSVPHGSVWYAMRLISIPDIDR